MILVNRYLLSLRRQQHRRFEEILDIERELYNAALQERRDAWRLSRTSISYQDQTGSFTEIRGFDERHAELPHALGCWTLAKLRDAFTGFFARVKRGQKPGFPRFKGAGGWDAFGMVNTDGCRLVRSKLHIKGVEGAVRMRMHRPIPDDTVVKRYEFVREGRRWFVCVTIEIEVAALHTRPDTSTGIDVGVERLATLADGSFHENVRPRCRRSRELKRAAQALARAKRGSRRRKAAKARLASIQRGVANVRRNHLHHVSKAITDTCAFVAVEDLRLRNMTRSAKGTLAEPGTNVRQKAGLNRALADAAPGRLIEMIRYKAERAGGEMVSVDAKGTSQECPICHAKVAKALSQRLHVCPCGAVMHRDHASAMVIHERGLIARAGGTTRLDANRKDRRKAEPTGRPTNAKPLAA